MISFMLPLYPVSSRKRHSAATFSARVGIGPGRFAFGGDNEGVARGGFASARGLTGSGVGMSNVGGSGAAQAVTDKATIRYVLLGAVKRMGLWHTVVTRSMAFAFEWAGVQ